jgi:hypothetical protein
MPIEFGLYHATTDSGNKYLIYLGVVVEELLSGNYSYTSGPVVFYTAGVNFKPLDASTLPNGSVTAITTNEISSDGGESFENVTITNLTVTEIKDSMGNNLLDVAEDELIIGDIDKPRQVEIISVGRPTVVHADESAHQVAYLSDMVESIFWQRSVDIICEHLTGSGTDDFVALNNQYVTVENDGSKDKVVTWQATPMQGYINVPGFYQTDPTAPDPLGYLFKSGEVALVKVSGTTEALPDGAINVELQPGSNPYPTGAITGVDKALLKGGAKGSGTTVVDKNGAIGYVMAVSGDIVTIMLSDESAEFRYNVPAYYKFNGSTWDFQSVIDVPKTFDNYVHDVTLEWGGVHAFSRVPTLKPYFVESYVMWTAHREDNQTVNYDGVNWSYLDLVMYGYRSSSEQDQVDSTLEVISTIQADFGETRSTMNSFLPGRPTEVVPNPAFIQNRPWTGVAVIDSGTFEQPLMYNGWLVDGGDFTGLNGAIQHGEEIAAVPSGQSYRNAIIRLWHGETWQMPENINGSEAVWNNFRYTMRWSDNEKILYFSDGNSMYKIADPTGSGYLTKIMTYSTPTVTSIFDHAQTGGSYTFVNDTDGLTFRMAGSVVDCIGGLWGYDTATKEGARLLTDGFKFYYTFGNTDDTYDVGDEVATVGKFEWSDIEITQQAGVTFNAGAIRYNAGLNLWKINLDGTLFSGTFTSGMSLGTINDIALKAVFIALDGNSLPDDSMFHIHILNGDITIVNATATPDDQITGLTLYANLVI